MLEETDSERKLRLQNKNNHAKNNGHKKLTLKKVDESIKQKQSEETDCQRQLRLQKRSYTSSLRSEETDEQRDVRLEKDRLYKRQKHEKTALQQNQMINQETYLSV